MYGNAPTDSTEPARQLSLLCQKPGGWRNSQVRADLSDDLRGYMDKQDGETLKPLLRLMRDEGSTSGYAATLEALEQVYASTGSLDMANIAVTASRIATGDKVIEYDEPVDLSIYDMVFSTGERGA